MFPELVLFTKLCRHCLVKPLSCAATLGCTPGIAFLNQKDKVLMVLTGDGDLQVYGKLRQKKDPQEIKGEWASQGTEGST
jgi:hypothetical protein